MSGLPFLMLLMILRPKCYLVVNKAVSGSCKMSIYFVHRSEVLTSIFISAEDAASSQSENKRRTTKKDFEIDFDDDIDFDVYFQKTKVCATFINTCASLSYLHLSSPFRCDF